MDERRYEIGPLATIIGVLSFMVIYCFALPFGLLLKLIAVKKKPGD